MTDTLDLVKEILELIQKNGLYWGIILLLLFIIVSLIKYPDKVDAWVSLISKWFSSFSRHAERSAVKRDIQAKVNKFSRNLEKECGTLTVPKINVEWIKLKGIDRDTFIWNGEVVVRLDYHKNQDKNLMQAALCYIPYAIIPDTRQFLEDNISRSIDLTVASKLFLAEGLQVAREYFYKDVLDKELANEDLKKYIEIMEQIDLRGLFTRLLLREFGRISETSYPRVILDQLRRETKSFVEFLHQIAIKDRNEDVDLNFEGDIFNICIVLVGKPQIIARRGIDPYLKWIKNHLKNENSIIYVFGAGKNLNLVKRLKANLKQNWSHKFRVSSESYHVSFEKGMKFKAICVIAIPHILLSSHISI